MARHATSLPLLDSCFCSFFNIKNSINATTKNAREKTILRVDGADSRTRRRWCYYNGAIYIEKKTYEKWRWRTVRSSRIFFFFQINHRRRRRRRSASAYDYIFRLLKRVRASARKGKEANFFGNFCETKVWTYLQPPPFVLTRCQLPFSNLFSFVSARAPNAELINVIFITRSMTCNHQDRTNKVT